MYRLYLSVLLLMLPFPARGAPPASRDAARAALQRLGAGAPLTVHWQPGRTRPTMIRGLDLKVPGVDNRARARRFLEQHPTLFATPASHLEELEQRQSRDRTVLRFRQRYRGLKVLDARAAVAFDSRGHIRAVRSSLKPVSLRSTSPRLTLHAAVAAARGAAGLPPGRGAGELVVLAFPAARLAYRVMLQGDPSMRFYLVDARTGAFLGTRRAVLIESPRGEVQR